MDEERGDPVDRLAGLLASEDNGEPVAEIEAPDEGQAEVEDDAEEAEAGYEAEAEAETDVDDEPEGSEEAEPTGAIEIEINGQTRKLTADEVRDGVLMRSDYTRKTQELAEMRQSFEAEKQQLAQHWQQQFQMLTELQDEPDWSRMRDEDPIGYIQEKAKWDDRAAKRQQLAQQQQMMTQQQRQQMLQQSSQRLTEALPSWNDAEVRQREQQAITKTLTNDYGFSPEDVSGVVDHRLVLMARDAMQWRQLQQGKDAVSKRVAGKPRVQKPGSAKPKASQQSEFQRDRARARKTGSRDDWTDVFAKHIV